MRTEAHHLSYVPEVRAGTLHLANVPAEAEAFWKCMLGRPFCQCLDVRAREHQLSNVLEVCAGADHLVSILEMSAAAHHLSNTLEVCAGHTVLSTSQK